MPRYNNTDRYQVGEYWLSLQSRSVSWCRTWYDHRTRQTKRVSLGTADFEEAKQVLNDWFILQHQQQHQDPQEVLLADLFARYYEQYGQKLKSAHLARLSLEYWLEFYGGKTVTETANVTEQERFHNWLIYNKRLKPNSAARIIAYGKAAISWSWKRGEIHHMPYFLPVKNIGVIPPRGRPLEVREVALMIKQAKATHLKDFIILMLATAARPDAVLDLTYGRCDFDNQLITLNAFDRVQTKKHRPTVKLPDELLPYLQSLKAQSESDHVINFQGRSIKRIKTAWKATRAKAELDDQVNPYSLRHTMARHMRRSGVPAWEVSAQLGHKTREASTTEIYAPFDPTYLSKAKAAIDDYICQVACELRVKEITELIG